jgi:hypothetical protein
MDLQTEKLLEKYWRGETSVAEEKMIKTYYQQYPDESIEASYFEKLNTEASKKPGRSFEHPGIKKRRIWLSVAAAILIGLISIPFIINSEKSPEPYAVEDPMEAFEVTRASLQMVSNGLNKGKIYSKELTKFNEAKQIIKKQ